MGATEGAESTSFGVVPERGSFDAALPTPPGSGAVLVLAGSDEPQLSAKINRLMMAVATTLDIRTDVLWTEVPDGAAFLTTLLDEITEDRHLVRVAFADPEASVDDLIRNSLMSADLDALAKAVERLRLSSNPPSYQVHYQPLVSLADRNIIGFESLIRAEADGERVDTEELINRAARGGWLGELDHLGRTLALKGVGPWLGQGLLFLNVMAPDGAFDVEAITKTVEQAIRSGLEPDQLVLEAVERNRYRDLDEASKQVAELRDLGVRIAVDDVGDGFASLRVVSQFKPDVVKIAGHLVGALPTPEATAIISAIVTLAHDTGSWVVAENIESEAQARALTSLGVDWGQGLHLGAPASRAGQERSNQASSRPLTTRN